MALTFIHMSVPSPEIQLGLRVMLTTVVLRKNFARGEIALR